MTGCFLQELATGDDHWEKSLAASADARRQAQLVERASRETHAKLLAAQEATCSFDKARREHMALEVLYCVFAPSSLESQPDILKAPASWTPDLDQSVSSFAHIYNIPAMPSTWLLNRNAS